MSGKCAAFSGGTSWQWYSDHYWTDIHEQAHDMDKLINEFNERTGVLKSL